MTPREVLQFNFLLTGSLESCPYIGRFEGLMYEQIKEENSQYSLNNLFIQEYYNRKPITNYYHFVV